MSNNNEKDITDLERVKDKLSKNREKILRNAEKIESGLETLEHAKRHKVQKNWKQS